MAIKAITDWVEQHSNWKESVLIVTADHGHDLTLDKPDVIARRRESSHEPTTSAK